MRTMFGVPVATLALVLAGLVGASVTILAALAIRNVVFFRLGIRNIGRRTARSALIVVGLMLSTTIIAAALGTGDTMGRTVRESVLSSLGNSDEWVTVKGAKTDLASQLAASAPTQMFSESAVTAVDGAVRGSGLVDGIAPAIVRSVAVQDQTSRQTEPVVTLFAPDTTRLAGFGAVTGSGGRPVDIGALAPGSVLANRAAADALHARRGDTIVVLTGASLVRLVVADIVNARGTGTARSGIILPLDAAQAAIGAPGMVDQILISNRGGETSGVGHTDAVVSRLQATLTPLGLEAQPLKRDGLDRADEAGATFISMFTTFGSFSIAAGILLIFLIFVMLAAERRTEMGVARAIGTQRGHLVQTFLFEGAAYDLAAAAVGALLGIAVSLAMVSAIARVFGAEAITIQYTVKWSSVVIAYTLGVFLTFLVVAFSAWRVSVLNIVTAVRNLPDPARRTHGRWSWLGGVVILALGSLLALSGRNAAQAMPFMLGLSLLAIGAVPVLRKLGVPDRVCYTGAGLSIVVIWLLPFRVIEVFVPHAQMDFSMWVVGGLLVVLGAIWTVIYNADAMVGVTNTVLGRVRSLSAVLRISMAYPLRNRLRTGMTLAMFTLVVFTLVVGVTTPSSFIASASKTSSYGGGYDVRAITAPSSPVPDMAGAVSKAGGVRSKNVRRVSSTSTIPIEAGQPSNSSTTAHRFVDYPLHGLDAEFLAHNRYALGSRARGYTSDAAVWDALARGDNVAVVDPWIVPHRRNWNFGALSDLKLSGLYAEDPTFAPVPLDVRDPESGIVTRFTVIGVLRDTIPLEMAGIATSQNALGGYGARGAPTTHLFALAPGVDADKFATRLESAFLVNGMQADSFEKLVHAATANSLVFLHLIEGFMGLGLVVGVAALGVVAARSVVERRQQIGVLRAIGFQSSTVRLGLLLESGFLALTSIVVGTALGLALAYNVIDDARRQATWPSVQLVVPWLNLVLIFAVVMVVALATTYLPARRASRVYPAEALRYQ
jgi:putative ABC transport system permease protein